MGAPVDFHALGKRLFDLAKQAASESFLTVEEAAKLLKVDSVTVQRELKAGRLPGAKIGRAWRIPHDELVRRFLATPNVEVKR